MKTTITLNSVHLRANPLKYSYPNGLADPLNMEKLEL